MNNDDYYRKYDQRLSRSQMTPREKSLAKTILHLQQRFSADISRDAALPAPYPLIRWSGPCRPQ